MFGVRIYWYLILSLFASLVAKKNMFIDYLIVVAGVLTADIVLGIIQYAVKVAVLKKQVKKNTINKRRK